MKPNTQQHSALPSSLIWVVGLLVLAGGFVANYYYAHIALPLRIIGWIVLLTVVLAILSRTVQGLHALGFIKESRVELRKVTWPTRQETVQTTMIIVAIVVIVGLLMWGLDSILLWAVSWLTGQRG